MASLQGDIVKKPSNARVLMSLISCPDYEKLQKLQDDFDLFSILDTAIIENSWSRVLAYLFDSRREHGLGVQTFFNWMSRILKNVNLKNQEGILKIVSQNKNYTTRCRTEWGTDERRRIDIVVELINERREIIAVVGVENKLWSDEQENQISDYQTALANAYPRIKKCLVFLSPNGRNSITSSKSNHCPVVSCTYQTIIEMCEDSLPTASKEFQVLLRSLKAHVEQRIFGRSKMADSACRLIEKLYKNPKHRQATSADCRQSALPQ